MPRSWPPLRCPSGAVRAPQLEHPGAPSTTVEAPAGSRILTRSAPGLTIAEAPRTSHVLGRSVTACATPSSTARPASSSPWATQRPWPRRWPPTSATPSSQPVTTPLLFPRSSAPSRRRRSSSRRRPLPRGPRRPSRYRPSRIERLGPASFPLARSLPAPRLYSKPRPRASQIPSTAHLKRIPTPCAKNAGWPPALKPSSLPYSQRSPIQSGGDPVRCSQIAANSPNSEKCYSCPYSRDMGESGLFARVHLSG